MNTHRTTSKSLLRRLTTFESEDAWNQFVKLYSPLLFFWAEQRMGLSRGEAEDLVQDLFIHLMNKLPEFNYDESKSFRSWLRVVLANKCRDYYRKANRLPENLESGQLRDEQISDNVQLFSDQEYHANLARRALELMKDEFEESTWKSCWMRVVEGKPAKEIARELGTSENAVHLAKSRVLRRLRDELDGLLEI